MDIADQETTECRETLMEIFKDLGSEEFNTFRILLQGIPEKIGKSELENISRNNLARLLVEKITPVETCKKRVSVLLNKSGRNDIPLRYKLFFNAAHAVENSPHAVEKKVVSESVYAKWKQQFASVTDYSLHFSLVKKLAQYGNSVGYIGAEGSTVSGSGFRLGSRYFITNFHVLSMMVNCNPSEENLESLTPRLYVTFNYEENIPNEAERDGIRAIKYCSQNPDYTILELSTDGDNHRLPGLHEFIKPSTSHDMGTYIALIGHPNGRLKQVDSRCSVVYNPAEDSQVRDAVAKHGDTTGIVTLFGYTQVIKYKDLLWYQLTQQDGTCNYQSSFLHGSSGSPGFNQDGHLVVIHTLGYFTPDGSNSIIEQGLLIDIIRKHLKDNNPTLAAEVFPGL